MSRRRINLNVYIICVTSENNCGMFNKLLENYLVGRLIQT